MFKEEEICLQQVLNVEEVERDSLEDDLMITNIKEIAQKDNDYQELQQTIINGFPNSIEKLNSGIRPYWNIRNNLSVVDDLILYNTRIVIPKEARKDILSKLLSSHQGIEKTKRRARLIVYWPCINNDISTTVAACVPCQEHRPSQQKEEIIQTETPKRVFEHVSMDFFTCYRKNYLVYTDCLSGWPCIENFGNGLSTKKLIHTCKKWFSQYGVPSTISSDGGPQFRSYEFQKFLQKYSVKHRMFSPYNSQSNGHAEINVKAMKQLILKTTDNGNIENDNFLTAILEYRNTPKHNGLSPAEILMGHQLRSNIPIHHSAFSSKWIKKDDELNKNISVQLKKSERYYNSSAKNLIPIKIGT